MVLKGAAEGGCKLKARTNAFPPWSVFFTNHISFLVSFTCPRHPGLMKNTNSG